MNAPETAAARPLCLWMTRTAEDAEASASPVRALGHHVMVEPLMTIERLEGPPLDLTGVQALLATSANGVRAFAARQPERSLPLLAVGDATARAAAAAGFQQVESAAGDVQALAELVRSRLDPAAGALLHIAASKRAGDLAGALSAAGFTCRRAVLYRARAAEALSGELAAMIREGRLDGALVFSPRTAATLARLLRQEKLADAAASMDLYCLSEAVAEAAAGLPWRRVIIAASPTLASLLESIDPAAEDETADLLRDSEPDGADSLSSSADFAGTVASKGPLSGIGGMNSEQQDQQRPSDDAAPDPQPPADLDQPVAPAPARSAEAPTEPAAPAPSGGAPSREPEGSPAQRSGSAETKKPIAPDAPASKPERPAPAKGGGGGLLWALLVLLLVGGAGAAAWFGYFQPRLQVAQAPQVDPLQQVAPALQELDARETRLRNQVAAITPRLDALERAIAELRKAADGLATRAEQGGSERTDQLAERLARLEGQAANTTSLAQQVRSLEVTTAAARDAASKLSTTVLGVGQLAQAVEGGGSFVRQLAAVRALGGDDPEIAQAAAALEPHATSGIPTLAVLRGKFPETAAAVASAEPVTAGDTWTDKVIDRLASLVSVRRTGSAALASGGVDGILARAETALKAGDLAGAVDALEELTGAPAQAASEWLALARTRLDAERQLITLQQRALARLSAAKG
ncbi:MAG: uroporphyrinogen-III synthase [Rhodospirillales bacterium]